MTLTVDCFEPDSSGRSGTMAKYKKRKKTRTAREARKTRVETVEGGYGRDFDKTERVISMDTVTAMFRRRQLTERQFNAADQYRRAYEFAPAVPSVMDDSKIGGGQSGSKSPTPSQLWASGILNDTAKILGQIDGAVVRMIAGEGFSIDQTARKMAHAASRRLGYMEAECKMVGRRFRQGLDRLALEWQGPERKEKGKIQSLASEGSRPTENRGNYERDPSHHAHASLDRETGQTIIVSKDGKAMALPRQK